MVPYVWVELLSGSRPCSERFSQCPHVFLPPKFSISKCTSSTRIDKQGMMQLFSKYCCVIATVKCFMLFKGVSLHDSLGKEEIGIEEYSFSQSTLEQV